MKSRWTTRTVFLTKKLAKEFASMHAHPAERRQNAYRMSWLAGLVESGSFHPPTWASIMCRATGIEYRCDGQHSSNVFHLGLASVPEGLKVTILQRTVDTLEELAEAYTEFNAPESSRNAHDHQAAFQTAIPSLANIPSHVISHIIGGIDMHLRGGFSKPVSWRHSIADKARRLYDYEDFAVFYYDIVADNDVERARSKHLASATVAAGILATYQDDAQLAQKFWVAVRDGSTEHGTPARKLEMMLRESVGGGRRTVNIQQRRLDEIEKQWVAFKNNEETADRPNVKLKLRGRRSRQVA